MIKPYEHNYNCEVNLGINHKKDKNMNQYVFMYIVSFVKYFGTNDKHIAKTYLKHAKLIPNKCIKHH